MVRLIAIGAVTRAVTRAVAFCTRARATCSGSMTIGIGLMKFLIRQKGAMTGQRRGKSGITNPPSHRRTQNETHPTGKRFTRSHFRLIFFSSSSHLLLIFLSFSSQKTAFLIGDYELNRLGSQRFSRLETKFLFHLCLDFGQLVN